MSKNLSLTSSGFVTVGAQAVTTVACLLPVKGSLNDIRRSLMHYGIPESLPTSSVLIAQPTHASRHSSLLRQIQNQVYPAPTSEISPNSAYRVSLTAAICIPYLLISPSTRAVLHCCLSYPALSINARTFHVPMDHLCLFLFVSTAKRDPR